MDLNPQLIFLLIIHLLLCVCNCVFISCFCFPKYLYCLYLLTPSANYIPLSMHRCIISWYIIQVSSWNCLQICFYYYICNLFIYDDNYFCGSLRLQHIIHNATESSRSEAEACDWQIARRSESFCLFLCLNLIIFLPFLCKCPRSSSDPINPLHFITVLPLGFCSF